MLIKSYARLIFMALTGFGLPALQAQSPASNLHPSWSYQSNIYEVNLRQFSGAGNFREFEKSLPRLRKMGVEILWFMPITPIGLEGRKGSASEMGSYYAVRDYYAVNPDYGSMDDWIALVRHAHQLGFKVILDWVPNHSSPDNPWINLHPDFYKKDSAGHAAIPFDWSDTRQLDYNNPMLRDSMIAAMEFWVTHTAIDGFRCDVAWNVPLDFWKKAIAQLRTHGPLFMLAEGELPGLHEAGFDETYPWSVMNVAYGIYSGKKTLAQLDSVLNHNDSIYPPGSFRLYFTTNHDENSWNGTEFERFGEGYKAFAVWAFTMESSVPLLYSGQEEPNRRRLKFFVKDTIAWKNYALAPFYSTLLHLRRNLPALSADASFRRVRAGNPRAVYAYVREKKGHKALVVLNLSGHSQTIRLEDPALSGNPRNAFTGQSRHLGKGFAFQAPPWGYYLFVYKGR